MGALVPLIRCASEAFPLKNRLTGFVTGHHQEAGAPKFGEAVLISIEDASTTARVSY